MKNLISLFFVSLFFVISLQAQNNPSTTYGVNSNPYGESGKCYAQCFIPGDTIKTTETIKIKPGYKEPKVVKGYPSTTKLEYVVKEVCSTCEFEVEKSTQVRDEKVVTKPGYWEYFTTACTYKTVYDTILIKEESVKYKIHPAVFEAETVKLANGGQIEEGICIPAVTKTEIRTVEIEEACTEIEVADYIWEDEEFTYEVQAASTIASGYWNRSLQMHHHSRIPQQRVGRHDAPEVHSGGLHGAARRAGAAAPGEPDSVPRRVRTRASVASAYHGCEG